MAELLPKERLQPSLLDRLIDDEPGNKQEPRTNRIISMAKLRQAVLRDLTWLFNTTNLASADATAKHPDVVHTVLNYGIPELAGHTCSGMDINNLEASLKQAILDFEPRILKTNLRIRAMINTQEMSHNAITFEVEGELWGQPAPEHLLLRTQVDLENGDVMITTM